MTTETIGDLMNKMQVSVEQVRISLIELEELKSSGGKRITAYCDTLRNDIEVIAESKKEEIDKLCTSLINEVNVYEKECLSKVDSENNKQMVARFDEVIADTHTFIDKWLSTYDIKRYKFDEEALQEAINAADKERQRVEKCKAQLRSAQFDDVAMKFREATTEIELGKVYFENLHIRPIDEMQKIELKAEPNFRVREIVRLSNGTYVAAAVDASNTNASLDPDLHPFGNILLLFNSEGKQCKTSR